MISEALQQPIDGLEISDVYLRWSRSECAQDFYPKEADYSALEAQHMHSVRRVDTFAVQDDGYLLRIFVLTGLRWARSRNDSSTAEQTDDDDDNADVRAFVEAEFIAEYRFRDELDTECLNEFAFKNASHHVWPYWREYLSSQVERLRLPRVTLPAVQLPHHRH